MWQLCHGTRKGSREVFHGLPAPVMTHRTLFFTPANGRRLALLLGTLRSREARFLALAGAGVPAVLGAVTLFWTSAWSPVALDRPADLLVAGHSADAVAAYERLAAGAGPAAVRAEARWRAAHLGAVHPADSGTAIARLETLLAGSPELSSHRRAEAHALVAGLQHREQQQPDAAAQHWERAAAIAPGHADAGRWLLQAGEAFAAAGAVRSAERVLTAPQAQAHDPSGAWLALARLRLTEDPAAAYDAYDRALRASGTGSAQQALARLGLATALERLEGREAALAELDEAWAEGEVVDRSLIRRRQRLQAGL